jgi:serine/threonine protein kinase
MAVHVINVNDEKEKVAVKVSNGNFDIVIVMSFEHAKYEVISRIDGISPFIIRLRSEFAVSNGFVMNCADETLPTWISSFKAATNPPFRNYHEDEPQLKLLLKPMFLNVLRGLKLLHQNNWYHMDVRPGNIVIYGGTARLIDWATASNESAPRELEFFQGHSDPFWPDPDKIPGILKQKAKWDLIGFGLVISFLCLTEENRELIFVRSGSRTEALQTYCSDYPAHSLVKVGCDIFNHCMNTELVDYDLIEKLISDA